jgi:hypothetical protein
MSNIPATFNDPQADPRALTLEYPAPKGVDTSYLKLYENQSLMMPSERQREFLAMKNGEKQWRADREAIFFDKKRHQMIERHHKQGVVGIDGPNYEGTKLYAGIREVNEMRRSKSETHAAGRKAHLAHQVRSSDYLRNYGEPPPASMARSADIPVQRKNVDPEVHPFRFLDTHERMHPHDTPFWDPERAKCLRSHDVRKRTFNIITGETVADTYAVLEREERRRVSLKPDW